MATHLERAAEFRAQARKVTEAAEASLLPKVRERLVSAAESWEALAEREDGFSAQETASAPPDGSSRG
jgi:hypothetical protein